MSLKKELEAEARAVESERKKWMAQSERDRRAAERDRERLVKERDAAVDRAEAAEADNAVLRNVIATVAVDQPGLVAKACRVLAPDMGAAHPGAALLEELRRLRELRQKGERLALQASHALGMMPMKSAAQAKLAECIEAWSVLHG